MANIKVAVRVRPLSKRETDSKAKVIVEVKGNTTTVINLKIPEGSEWDSRERYRNFQFDYSYSSITPHESTAATQELVFRDLGVEVIESVLDGYNACVFAYGQSGSGKSYTMMGCPDELGLTPRLCEQLFNRLDNAVEEKVTFRADVSFLEIYNERVRDLLRAPTSRRKKLTLKIREHPKKGTYVQDLTRHKVTNFATVLTLIEKGNKNRSVASTETHDHSSRSHAIFTINFTQAHLDAELPSEIVSKINLVDLAGSERASIEFNRNRLKEGGNINKSLVTLGNVISALADKSLSSWSLDSLGSSFSINSSAGESVATTPASSPRRLRQPFVPYRDSVLTWLLKDSLGGNSKTIMIATISPASTCYNETINTLRYAQRAKCIVNRPVINEEPNVKLIRELRAEISRLRTLLTTAQISNIIPSSFDEVSINEILNQNENKALALTRSWIEKWHGSEAILTEHEMLIRKSNAGVVVDSPLPHLVALDNHVLSTGIYIYYLKQGTTSLGRNELPSVASDVESDSEAVEDCCQLHFDGINVTLSPMTADSCQVNGQLVCQPTQLKQADIVKIGKHHNLRFNNPAEVLKLKEKNKRNETYWDSGIQSDSILWNDGETSTSRNWSSSVENSVELEENTLYSSLTHVNGAVLTTVESSDAQLMLETQHEPKLSESCDTNLIVGSFLFPACSEHCDDNQNGHGELSSSVRCAAVVNGRTSLSQCDCGAVVSTSCQMLSSNDLSWDQEKRCINSESTCSNQLLCNNNDLLCNSKCQSQESGCSDNCHLGKSPSLMQFERHSRDEVMSRNVETFLHSPPALTESHALECLSPKVGLQVEGSDDCGSVLEHIKIKLAGDGLYCEPAVANRASKHKYDCANATEGDEFCEANTPLHLEPDNESISSAMLVYSVMENGLSYTLTDSSDSGITCTRDKERSLQLVSEVKTYGGKLDLAGSEENSLTESQKTGALVSQLSEEACFSSNEPVATDNECSLELVHTSTPCSSTVDSFQTSSCGLCGANSWESVPGIDLGHNSDHERSCFCEKSSERSSVAFVFNKPLHLVNSRHSKLTNHKTACVSRCVQRNSCAYKRKRGRHRRPVKIKRVISIKKGLRSSRRDDRTVKHVNKLFPTEGVSFSAPPPTVAFVPETNTESCVSCTSDESQAVVQSGKVDDISGAEEQTLSSSQLCHGPVSSHHHNSGDPFNPTLLSEAKNFVTFAKDITDSQQLVDVLQKQMCVEKKQSDCAQNSPVPTNNNKEQVARSPARCSGLSPEMRLLIAQSATDIHNDILAKEEATLTSEAMPNRVNLCISENVTESQQVVSTQCTMNSVPDVHADITETKQARIVFSNQTAEPPSHISNNDDLMLMGQQRLAGENTNMVKCGVDRSNCMDKKSCNDNDPARNGFNVDLMGVNLPDAGKSVSKIADNGNASRKPRGIPIVQLSLSVCSVENEGDNELVTSPIPNANFLSVTPPFSPVELKRSLSNTDIQQSLQKEVPLGEEDSNFCPAVSSPFKVRTNSWPEPSQLSLDQLDNEIRDLQEGLKEELVNEVMVQIGQDGIDMTEVSQCLKDVLDSYPSEVVTSEVSETKRNFPHDQSDATEQFSDSLDETDDNRRLKRAHLSYQSLSPCSLMPKCPNSETFLSHTPSSGISFQELVLHSKSSDSDCHYCTLPKKSVSSKVSKKLIRQRARLCLCQENDSGGPSEDGCYSDDSLVEKCQRHSKRVKVNSDAITTGTEVYRAQPIFETADKRKQCASSPLKQTLPIKDGSSPLHTEKLSPKTNILSPTSQKRLSIRRSPRTKRRLERLTKITGSTDFDDALRIGDNLEEREFILTVVDGHASMACSSESFSLQYDEDDPCVNLAVPESSVSKVNLDENERNILEKEMPQIFLTRPSIPNGAISPEEISEIEEAIEGITDEESGASYVDDEFESDNSEEDEDSEEDDEDDDDETDEEVEERYYIPINASMHVQPETSVHGNDTIGQLRTMAEVGLSPVNLCLDGSTSSMEERKLSQCNLFTDVGGTTANSSGQNLSGSVGEQSLVSSQIGVESFLSDGAACSHRTGRENFSPFHANHIGGLEFLKFSDTNTYEDNGACLQGKTAESVEIESDTPNGCFSVSQPVNCNNIPLLASQDYTGGRTADHLLVETSSWEALDTISLCGSDSYTLSSDTSHEDVFTDNDIHMSPVDILIDYRILSPSERRRLYTIPEMSSEYSSTPSDGVIGSIEFEAGSAFEDGASVIEFCDHEVTTLSYNNNLTEVNDTGHEFSLTTDSEQQASATSLISITSHSTTLTANATEGNSLSSSYELGGECPSESDNIFQQPLDNATKATCISETASTGCSDNNELKHSSKLPSHDGENESSLHLQHESQLKVGAATSVVLDNSCDLGTPIQHDSCPVESPGQLITQPAVVDQQTQFLASSEQNSQPESGECRELWKLYKRFSEESDEEEKEEEKPVEVDTVGADASGDGPKLNPCVEAFTEAGKSMNCDEAKSKAEALRVESELHTNLECADSVIKKSKEEKMVIQCTQTCITEDKVTLHDSHKSTDLYAISDEMKSTVYGATMKLAHVQACSSFSDSEVIENEPKAFTSKNMTPLITDTSIICKSNSNLLNISEEINLAEGDLSSATQLQVAHKDKCVSNSKSFEAIQEQVGAYSVSAEQIEESNCAMTSSLTEFKTTDLHIVTASIENSTLACSSVEDGVRFTLLCTDPTETVVSHTDPNCTDTLAKCTSPLHELVNDITKQHKEVFSIQDTTMCSKDKPSDVSTCIEESVLAVQTTYLAPSSELCADNLNTKQCTANEMKQNLTSVHVKNCNTEADCVNVVSFTQKNLNTAESAEPLSNSETNDAVCVSDIDIYIDSLFTDALSEAKPTLTSETNSADCTNVEAVEDANLFLPNPLPSHENVPFNSELFVSTWPVTNSSESVLISDGYAGDGDKVNKNASCDAEIQIATSSDVQCSSPQLVGVVNNKCNFLPAIEISSVKSPNSVHNFSPEVTPRSQFLYPSSEESERGRESSITPDSLESLCRDTASALLPAASGNNFQPLTSWCNHHTTGNHFTIRSKPVTKAPAYRAARHRNLDLGTFNDLWGASSDSITFVFVGPGPCNGVENQGYDRQRPNSSLSDSDTMPYSTIGLYPYFKTPCSIMPRSVSLDCIHLQRHYGMTQLTARAASMESMVPEDLMGVVERGRLHEIDLEELNGKSVTSNCSPTNKSNRDGAQIPWSQNLVAKYPTKYVWCCGKAFSQGSVADESSADKTSNSFRKCKKSVSWSDLSGYELISDADSPTIKQRKPRFLKPIIKKLETPLVEHPPDNAFREYNPPTSNGPVADDKTEYTDNDIDKDLMNSALYKRIQKRANPQAWMQSQPQTATFSLKLPDHVKARIGRPPTEHTAIEYLADSQVKETTGEKSDEIQPQQNAVDATNECTDQDVVEGQETPPSFNEVANDHTEPIAFNPPVLSQVLTNFVSKKEIFLGAPMSDIVAQLQPNSSPSAPADWAGLSSVMMEASNFFRELSKFCVAKTPTNVLSSTPNIVPKTERGINATATKCKRETGTQTDSSALNMVTSGTVTELNCNVSSSSTQTATDMGIQEHVDMRRHHYFNDTANTNVEHTPFYQQENGNVSFPFQSKLDQNSRTSSFQSDKFLPILVNSTTKHIPFNNASSPVKPSTSGSDLSRQREYKLLPALDTAPPAKTLHIQSRAREVSRNRREACLKKELEILTQEKARVLVLLQQFCSANAWQSDPNVMNGGKCEEDLLTNGFHSDEDMEGCGSWESVQYLVTYQARLQEACSRVTTKLEKLARQSRVEDYVFHQVGQISSDSSSCSPPSSEYIPLNHNSQVSMTPHPFCSEYAPFSSHNFSSVLAGRAATDIDLAASPSWANLSQSSGSSAPQQQSRSITSSLSQKSRSRTSGERLRPREYQAHLLDIRRTLVAASRSSSSSTRSPLSRTPPSPPQRSLLPDGVAPLAFVSDKLTDNIKLSDGRMSSRESSLDCADNSHPFNSSKSISSDSSAEDIQKLLEECRAARVRAQIEIELAQQQLKSQRLAVRSLETMFKQRT